jgi:hypothetical protein
MFTPVAPFVAPFHTWAAKPKEERARKGPVDETWLVIAVGINLPSAEKGTVIVLLALEVRQQFLVTERNQLINDAAAEPALVEAEIDERAQTDDGDVLLHTTLLVEGR